MLSCTSKYFSYIFLHDEVKLLFTYLLYVLCVYFLCSFVRVLYSIALCCCCCFCAAVVVVQGKLIEPFFIIRCKIFFYLLPLRVHYIFIVTSSFPLIGLKMRVMVVVG